MRRLGALVAQERLCFWGHQSQHTPSEKDKNIPKGEHVLEYV